MNKKQILRLSLAALIASSASMASAQAPAVPAAPTPTIWRFMGIPQGLQKIRDVTVNRRGNFPGLERKPPLKRIGDPANLESDNPAIKAAAEIKQAEDMKLQKIKAIKFLAKMGCGCYDKQGKITDALLAAMDDCTPDVREAAIKAIEDAANGECCKSCGSTSCCSEKVTKRLSEIAYERDDTGCPLEPNAEVREAAAKALCACCPNRATGPIEEDIPEVPDEEDEKDPDPIKGEGQDDPDAIQGEGTGTDEELQGDGDEGDTEPADSDSDGNVEELPSAADSNDAEVKPNDAVKNLKPMPILLNSAQRGDVKVELGSVKMIGGMAIQPVTITPVAATEEALASQPEAREPVEFSLSDDKVPEQAATKPAPLPQPVALPIAKSEAAPLTSGRQSSVSRKSPAVTRKVEAKIVGVDHKTGNVALRSGQQMRPGASVTVYHSYLTGERLVAHLIVKTVNGSQAVAVATDRSGLMRIEAGDRAVCF